MPALERNILRLRSMQIVLVLFYAEQLKQKVLNLIQNTDKFHSRMVSGTTERAPKGAKGQVKKCLNALMADGAISTAEKDEIKRLIDYRNVVGHDIHELVADLSTERYIRASLDLAPDRSAAYDYEAADRLRHYLHLLSERQIKHHYIGTISMDSLTFISAERTLRADIKKLKGKIQRLADERNKKIHELNEQLKLEDTVGNEGYPDHPLNQYDDKRLTRRGQEICYRLFDKGKQPMAIAHLMGISLTAARKRKGMWDQATRPTVDLDSLPRRKFYRRDRD
ncbi:hypothetical protein DBIPINDM_005029 [Mesorhizobium sp. AR02]|uniref:hypothetical protein n=1 Tax=Mesorhizobium sp. AR02 TaxID=2865837 RepID=UPI00215F4582|nr:hypothetical protein [Mesorhizobium sp. AR02]UVK51725.1 hypothetical protein DBIPINDM_005029 [Mesorhizobium sp. AR02]